MRSVTVEAACKARGLAFVDPLVLDNVGADFATLARASILQWGADLLWRGRMSFQHPKGWKSPMGVLHIPYPGCREFGFAIAEAVGGKPSERWARNSTEGGVKNDFRERLQAWAMVNWAGAEHNAHTHGGVDASGVYYFDDGGTPTIFEQWSWPLAMPIPTFGHPLECAPPLPLASDGSIGADRDAKLKIAPRPGRLALFSGALRHRVPCVEIPENLAERVTIAFNVL